MLKRNRILRVFVSTALVAILLSAGYILGWNTAREEPAFHDHHVNYADDYTALVDPESQGVRSLASRFRTPDEAYAYVLDKVNLVTSLAAAHPDEVIASGNASCLGKAILLCSLYRAMGVPADDVRVILGELTVDGRDFDHAWLDLEVGDLCFQQDPSGLFAWFKADSFPGNSYTRRFARREHFCFNDQGFAVMSQVNRFRGTDGPGESVDWVGP